MLLLVSSFCQTNFPFFGNVKQLTYRLCKSSDLQRQKSHFEPLIYMWEDLDSPYLFKYQIKRMSCIQNIFAFISPIFCKQNQSLVCMVLESVQQSNYDRFLGILMRSEIMLCTGNSKCAMEFVKINISGAFNI